MLTIYSRTQCPHCTNAKNYLESRNINFQEINIEHDPRARDFLLAQGHRSVPQIYLGDRLLVEGGWSALSRMDTQQVLDRISEIMQPNLGDL